MIEDKTLKLSEEFADKKISEEDASHTFIAREIVQEITKFGVSQITLQKIIELLALELESRERMLAVIGAVKGNIVVSDTPILSE